MNQKHLRTMLWLRWRLAVNQWRRGGGVNAAITMILAVIGLGLAVAGAAAGVAGGLLGLTEARPPMTMIVWDVLVALFLFFWAFGLVMELQRSEIIDLSRLLHLPVSLRDVFLLNYLASHLTFSLAIMLPSMLGLVVGLVMGRGLAMALLFPLVFGFFFMITAWTYCLRGWLAALMVNKRRRRAIVMGVTMAFVLLAQLPNLANVWFGGRHSRSSRAPSAVQVQDGSEARAEAMFTAAHYYIPILWPAQGAKGLAEGNAWPAVWGAFGMIAIGAWGLARAYRLTIRFYQGGETNQSTPAPTAEQTVSTGGRIMVERTLPVIPEEATAMAFASLRSMLRAPEIKMALATNVVIFTILGANMLMRRSGGLPAATQPFVGSAAVAVTLMGLIQVMSNHFGFDRSGFRAIVLLPTPRRYILLGKNLAMLPLALVMLGIYLGMAAALAHLGVTDLLATGFEFGFAFLALSVMGNLISILFPYRITPGTLRPTKIGSSTKLMMFVTHLLMLPLVVLPIFLPAGLGLMSGRWPWLPGDALKLPCAMMLAILGALFYWLTQEPLGRLLQRREQTILQVVTQEVE